MATVEDLKASVEKATEKVEKIKGTIAKHEASAAKKLSALEKVGVTADNMKEVWNASSYETKSLIGDYEMKLDDIKGASRKLKDAEAVLAGWIAKLNIEVEKERFLNDEAPEVIKEFLNKWKEMAYGWHIKKYDDYLEFKEKLEEKVKLAKEEWKATVENIYDYRAEEKFLKTKNLDYKTVEAKKAAFAGGAVLTMYSFYDEEERLAWLEKELEKEKKAKMMDLIRRVNEVVGSITDASGLSIDVKGNLNGFIIGTTGKAEVETIGAGGWNIQCFHYRVLVKTIKKGA